VIFIETFGSNYKGSFLLLFEVRKESIDAYAVCEPFDEKTKYTE
jgi:hypothetical protein